MSRVRFDDAAVTLEAANFLIVFELLSLKLRAGSYFWFCKQRRRLEDVSGCLLDLVYLRKYSLS